MMIPTNNTAPLPEPTRVGSHRIQFAAPLSEMLIDQTLVRFSAGEYHILHLLLTHADRCVPYRHLLACTGETVPSERVPLRQARNRLMHAISRIRGKIWPCGLDIVSVMGRGYLLFSSAADDEYDTPGDSLS